MAREAIHPAQGLPDFSIFYTAGRILRDRQGSRLYDDALQESVQRSFSPLAVQRRGGILPYNHPPFEALLFVPLAHLPYVTAYLTWFLVNGALLGSIPFLLRTRLKALGHAPLYLWLLACLGFFPIFYRSHSGSGFHFVAVSLLPDLCVCGTPFRVFGGRLVGIGPVQVSCRGPVCSALVEAQEADRGLSVRRRKSGPYQPGHYRMAGSSRLSALRVGERARREVCLEFAPVTHREPARADFSHGPGGGAPRDPELLTRMFLAMVLLLMMYTAGKTLWADSGRRQAMLALNLVGTILISYHIFVHDPSLLFLAVLLVLELLLSDRPLPNATRTTLWVCIAILFFSPLYQVLSLRYRQLQLMAIVLVVFFLGLLSLVHSLHTRPDGPVSPGASEGR